MNANMRDTLDQLAALGEKLSAEQTAKARDTYNTARTMMLGLGIAAVVVAILAAVIVTRSLIKQLGGEPGYAARVLQTVAAGDLSVSITLREGDESSMLFAVGSMIEKLKLVIDGQKRVVKAANRGEFGERIDLDGLAGFTGYRAASGLRSTGAHRLHPGNGQGEQQIRDTARCHPGTGRGRAACDLRTRRSGHAIAIRLERRPVIAI